MFNFVLKVSKKLRPYMFFFSNKCARVTSSHFVFLPPPPIIRRSRAVTLNGKTFVLNRSASSDSSLYSILAGEPGEDTDDSENDRPRGFENDTLQQKTHAKPGLF